MIRLPAGCGLLRWKPGSIASLLWQMISNISNWLVLQRRLVFVGSVEPHGFLDTACLVSQHLWPGDKEWSSSYTRSKQSKTNHMSTICYGYWIDSKRFLMHQNFPNVACLCVGYFQTRALENKQMPPIQKQVWVASCCTSLNKRLGWRWYRVENRSTDLTCTVSIPASSISETMVTTSLVSRCSQDKYIPNNVCLSPACWLPIAFFFALTKSRATLQ